MDHADVLIVGGGSAGAALAARLSEAPTLRILLVEAGRDISLTRPTVPLWHKPPDAVQLRSLIFKGQ
jgi:choline dehydrogenase-like flavoprotein